MDQQHAYKTKGMTNKTHPKGSREMLEGPRPGNSKEVVKCVEKNETWTKYDTGAKEKMKDDMGIKRTSLEKHSKKQLENAELLECKSFQEEDKDKRLKNSQTSHEFDQIICDQGGTGRVQQKESNTDRLEYLKTDNSLHLETVTTECPSITGLYSYSTTDSVTGQTDLGFQRDRNISAVSPSVTDMSTCVLKEPNGATEAYSNFTTAHKRSFELDRRNQTFKGSLPMLRRKESISRECSRSEGKNKLLNIPVDETQLVQENCLLKCKVTPFDSFDTEIDTEPTNADIAPVLLRIEEDFEQVVLCTFHPDLKHSNTLSRVLFHTEKQTADKGAFNVMEKCSTAMSSES